MKLDIVTMKIIKDINNMQENKKDNIKNNIKDNIESPLQQSNHIPKQTETMRRNKSMDDFMKHHVPWIL